MYLCLNTTSDGYSMLAAYKDGASLLSTSRHALRIAAQAPDDCSRSLGRLGERRDWPVFCGRDEIFPLTFLFLFPFPFLRLNSLYVAFLSFSVIFLDRCSSSSPPPPPPPSLALPLLLCLSFTHSLFWLRYLLRSFLLSRLLTLLNFIHTHSSHSLLLCSTVADSVQLPSLLFCASF